MQAPPGLEPGELKRSTRYCTRLQGNDGYSYLIARKEKRGFLPVPFRGRVPAMHILWLAYKVF